MRVLLDEHLPIGLAAEVPGYAVDTVSGRGWIGIKNGELLRRMTGQYDVLVAMDRGIEFQQRISALPFGIMLLRAPSNRMQDLKPLVPSILSVLHAIDPGRILRVGVDQEASMRFSRQSLHSPDTSTEKMASGVYTELQCRSYIFIDADYGRNRDRDGEPTKAFKPSLFVWSTVMSRPTGDRAIVAAGLKALAFDSGPPLAATSPPRPTSAPSTSTAGSPSRPRPTGSGSATRSN